MKPALFKDLLAALLVLILPQNIWAKLCSDVLSRNEIKEVEYKQPCIQKYTARCGWLSLDYCTFYHQTYCDKKKNDTVTTYYVQTRCCKGYYRAPNGACLSMKYDVPKIKTTAKSPEYVLISNGGNQSQKIEVHAVKQTNQKPEIEISAGGYAGIICGFVFICSVVFFIFRAVRKRQTWKKARKPALPGTVEYVSTSNPASPTNKASESMLLSPPLSVALAARNNRNNNDEGTPLSSAAIEEAESAGEVSDHIHDVGNIPESVV